MTSTSSSRPTISARELLAELKLSVGQERQATAHVIALLMEVDARRLYAQQSCSSLFSYCVQVLHLSEACCVFANRGGASSSTLSSNFGSTCRWVRPSHGVESGRPASHRCEPSRCSMLLGHKTKREVEQLVAHLRPQPDVPSVVRRLPTLPPKAVPQTVPVNDPLGAC
jgi:hypothetical protein